MAINIAEIPVPSRLGDNPWQDWRDLMPITQQWAYLDHAAVGPLSLMAAQAMRRFADQGSLLGDTVWPEWAAKADALRQSTAAILNAEASEICIVANTTSGINLVAEGWPWQPGDNIIIPDGEFPSNLFPWMNQQSKGVELRVAPRREGAVHVDDLMYHVDESTRMIAVSWVGYASGYRIDIHDLVQRAHQRGVKVFLDAIQGLGIYPLDVRETPVDFLAADGHKWLLGPEGAGVAFIRGEHQDTLRPTNVGWASVKNSYNYAEPQFDLRDTAARFESGSANLVGISALAANMEFFASVRQQLGDDAIAKRILNLANRLRDRLAECGVDSNLAKDPANQSGIVTFFVPGHSPAVIRKQCAEQNIVVSCRGGGVRASIHAYNNDKDIDQLIQVLQTIQNS